MKTFVKNLYNAFETKARNNGNNYVTLKKEKRNEFKDIVREMHGTDIMPDDFRFKTIESILGSILDVVDFADLETPQGLENALSESRHEIVEGLVDIYTPNLTQWLASHSYRPSYVDEASETFGTPSEFIKGVQMGQFYEIDLIYSNVVNALVDYFETEMVA